MIAFSTDMSIKSTFGGYVSTKTDFANMTRSLFEKTTDYIRTNLPKVYSHELVSLIFELPYCRIRNLTETGIAKRQTASAYLKQLVEIGVLTEITVSKEKLFLHPKLMRLLTTESNDYAPYICGQKTPSGS